MSNTKGMSLEELYALKAEVEQTLLEAREHRVASLRDEAQRLADEEGLSLEVFVRSRLIDAPKPKAAPQAKRGDAPKLPPKYVNPENPKETWSGWATKPKWVKEWLAVGGDLEDLRIHDEPQVTSQNGLRA